MSVVSFDEIHNGRDGGDELSTDGRMVSRYTRVFRVITDSALDEASVILTHASCPKVGSIYQSDSLAFCRRVRPRQESFSKLVWIVTAAYSTERELEVDPLNESAAISWSTVNYTRPYFKNIDGTAILNTAGFYFDPPIEGDDSRWGANVRKNVAGVPGWLGVYRGAINLDVFVLDGFPVRNQVARLSGMEISEWQQRNEVWFRVLTMRIDIDEDTWIKQTLNDGLYEIAAPGEKPKKMTDKDGQEGTEPWPLDADGKQIANPTPANVISVPSSIYKILPFSALPLA